VTCGREQTSAVTRLSPMIGDTGAGFREITGIGKILGSAVVGEGRGLWSSAA
jgi:hypothetical protein